jgi:hypothetical protein
MPKFIILAMLFAMISSLQAGYKVDIGLTVGEV